MSKFIGKMLVTYEFEADSWEDADEILQMNTEFPLFPDGIGGYVSDEIVMLEEVK